VTPDRSDHVLDLAGLVRVGLRDAEPRDVERIRRQLGPLPDAAPGPADLEIRYVDRLAVDGPLRHLGRDAAATDTTFLVLRGRRKTTVRVAIPVDAIGTVPFHVGVERVAPAIPFLLPIAALTMTARGGIPAHASAFETEGRGILVTGWAKGGKSEALLAFADHGASYVGDEWVFISADGGTMAGLPEPMRLWDWQLDQMPAIRDRIGRRQRTRLSLASGTSRALQAAAGAPGLRDGAPGDVARRLGALAENQRSIQVPPAVLFGERVLSGPRPLDAVVLIEAVSDGAALAEPIPSDVVARRMAASVVHELLDLQALSLAFRFAFPDRAVAALDDLRPTLEAALERALAATPCVLVRHPYPADIAGLYDLISAALAGVTTPSGAMPHHDPLSTA
jgi:hypothetical protein